jgi:polysaccharide deacetylase family protein (PEP-CTERM system associated)
VLAYRVGRAAFREDLRRARGVLEDLGAGPVRGFRAAGFSVTAETPWAFDEIRAAGHEYDASVFPAGRGHGGMRTAPLTPYTVQTDTGALVELPNSVVTLLGRRVSLFGGGYLRLAPLWLIRRGVRRLQRAGRPVIVYVHPREVDPTHPRLPLPAARRFKSYVGLRSTLPKLEWLCAHGRFEQMHELAEHVRDHG